MRFEGDRYDLSLPVRAVAAADPERVAVLHPQRRKGQWVVERHTYRELEMAAQSLVAALQERGIQAGTRVVFMAPPSFQSAAFAVALSHLGVTQIMIDPSVGYRNVHERLSRVSPEVFVGAPLAHWARVLFGWGPRFPSQAFVVDGKFPGASSFETLRQTAGRGWGESAVGPNDPAVVLYTTGSTGPAKPALYSQREFCNVLRVAHHCWGFEEAGDPVVDMPVFPAFTMIGLSAGGTVAVPPIRFGRETPEKTDVAALWEAIELTETRTLFASPVILENLGRHAAAGGLQASSLRRIIGGGAPITGPSMARLQAMMPQGEVHSNYGSTEALPVSAHSARATLGETWADTERGRGICVGPPVPGVEIRIGRIQEGRATGFEDCPQGEIGEVLARGGNISSSYLNDRESVAENKIGSWHRLGDAGFLDEQGRLWVVGRVSHRVPSPAGTLYPLQVEAIFNREPGVRRTGLVAVGGGDAPVPVLCVEPEPGVAETALRERLLELAANDPRTRAIGEIVMLERLPVDPRHNSKIDRPRLSRMATRRNRGR